MGGNSSHEAEIIDADEVLWRATDVPGLKNGDVVKVKGEAFAGANKFFVINFCSGNDIAFHFKVILLEAEGSSNKVKMNSRTGGNWGSELYKDNVIYLNHHFELQFKCLSDKFSVELDGTHFCDFTHRFPPGSIHYIMFNGDAVWKEVIAPGKVPGPGANKNHLPRPEEIKKFLRNLRETHTPRAGENREEIEKISGLLQDGLEVTKSLLGEDKWGFVKQIVKYGGYLSKIYAAGSGAYKFFKFVNGDPSDMKKITEALQEIKGQLDKIDATIQKGFNEVIKHLDFIQFREKVAIPLETVFNLYTRCYTVRGSKPIEEFKAQCSGEKSPQALLTALFQFLDNSNNIIQSHLKDSDYDYAVFKEWSNAIFNLATKMMTVDMFYYGLLSEEATSKNEKPVIDKEDECAQLISQIMKMDGVLKKIDAERMKLYHSGGFAKKPLRKIFEKIKYEKGNFRHQLPQDTLARIAYQMKNAWKDVNGPEDYYIMVVRGTYGRNTTKEWQRHAAWYIGDTGRVTVVENIGEMSTDDDCISLVLIQPVTEEIREANRKVNKEQKDRLKGIVENAKDRSEILPSKTLAKIQKHIPFVDCKPLLIMYNTGFELHDSQKNTNNIEVLPIKYDMTNEAWSNPGGPFPWKYYWKTLHTDDVVHRQVQFIFQ